MVSLYSAACATCCIDYNHHPGRRLWPEWCNSFNRKGNRDFANYIRLARTRSRTSAGAGAPPHSYIYGAGDRRRQRSAKLEDGHAQGV